MRFVISFLALVALPLPAFACAMDGMYGAHRFNPFLSMQTGALDQSVDQEAELSDSRDDYSDRSDDTEKEDQDHEVAEYDPRDL